ncbi:MAG: thioredoxin domain-containing protein [Parachlamydiales bacterium]|nr:thioredoxin domain-containing protein [Parachlamydiales bacterium]
MKKYYNKVLVVFTAALAVAIALIVFWVDLVCPKKLDEGFLLSFGDKGAKVNVVVFEDFQCKFCKKLSNEYFPFIKEKYLNNDKISYSIIPVAFICGSKPIANAAIAIYELNKDQFFEFLKIVSNSEQKIETKQDLINIAKSLKGVNIEIFKELLEKEVFNEYLDDNLLLSKNLMRRRFQVPSIFVNGQKVELKNLEKTIDEYLEIKGIK